MSADGTERFIHRLRCPDCGTIARADKPVKCVGCASLMDRVGRIGIVYDTGVTRDGGDS
jgi:ribosomal protein S27E